MVHIKKEIIVIFRNVRKEALYKYLVGNRGPRKTRCLYVWWILKAQKFYNKLPKQMSSETEIQNDPRHQDVS